MGWIDTIVITLVVCIGIFILYRPLKEPIDAFFRMIGRMFGFVRDSVIDRGRSSSEIISYG